MPGGRHKGQQENWRGMAGHKRTIRHLWCAALLVALGISTVAVASPVAAQQGEPDEVVRGGANASADSIGIQIVNAGASLGWVFGRSTAAYRDITATAEGKAVDLGALEALLGQAQCNGELPPALDPETVPPRTIADSNLEGSELEKSAEVAQPKLTGDTSAPVVVGTQSASARDTPASSSSTAIRDQDFGFFRIIGATSSASTSFEDGVRTATAETRATRIEVLGGQVVFNDPVWTATTRSGATSANEAEFGFRSARVFGNIVSGSVLERDLAIFETILEGLLSPLGLDLRFPEVRRPLTGDGVEVTPLAVSMADAPLGKDLLIPLLRSDLLQNYRAESVSEDCRRETFWTIIDAIERALGGSGSIEIAVGGAVATTDDTDYSVEPIAELAPPSTTPTTTAPAPLQAPAPDDFGSYGDLGYTSDYSGDPGLDFADDLSTLPPETPTADLPAPVAEVAGVAEDAGDDPGRDELAAATDISAGDTSGSDDAALVVGIVALLGAIGLSLGDRFAGFRSRRRIT